MSLQSPLAHSQGKKKQESRKQFIKY